MQASLIPRFAMARGYVGPVANTTKIIVECWGAKEPGVSLVFTPASWMRNADLKASQHATVLTFLGRQPISTQGKVRSFVD